MSDLKTNWFHTAITDQNSEAPSTFSMIWISLHWREYLRRLILGAPFDSGWSFPLVSDLFHWCVRTEALCVYCWVFFEHCVALFFGTKKTQKTNHCFSKLCFAIVHRCQAQTCTTLKFCELLYFYGSYHKYLMHNWNFKWYAHTDFVCFSPANLIIITLQAVLHCLGCLLWYGLSAVSQYAASVLSLLPSAPRERA